MPPALRHTSCSCAECTAIRAYCDLLLDRDRWRQRAGGAEEELSKARRELARERAENERMRRQVERERAERRAA